MRIGVIGLGFMGSTHLKAWKNVQNAQVAAVCSDDPKKLAGDLSAIQGNLGGPGEKFDFSAVARYRKPEELIADPDVDAVDVCLPTHLHASVSVAALRAGKHVLVEKPMALNSDEADQMVAEARGAGKILMVGQILRFLPSYRALADLLRSGEYGQVRGAVLRRRCSAPFWSEWLGDPGRSGGGVFDLLIHDIDFALYLFGKPGEVAATGYEDLSNGVDLLDARLMYGNGLSVLITGGWHHRKAYPFSMEFTVVADGGTFEYNSAAGPGVTLYRADGEAQSLKLPEEDGFERELRYFAESCAANRWPEICPPEESAEAVRAAEALLRARKSFWERSAATA